MRFGSGDDAVHTPRREDRKAFQLRAALHQQRSGSVKGFFFFLQKFEHFLFFCNFIFLLTISSGWKQLQTAPKFPLCVNFCNKKTFSREFLCSSVGFFVLASIVRRVCLLPGFIVYTTHLLRQERLSWTHTQTQ